MEFEDVDERVEWEARRVAAAFGVESFEPECLKEVLECQSQLSEIVIRWHIDLRDGTLHFVHIYQSEQESGSVVQECCVLLTSYWNASQGDSVLVSLAHSNLDQVMARGLYRLGFQDEEVLCQLPALSAHEKMEARLSMPREFWPKTWLEEEANRLGQCFDILVRVSWDVSAIVSS